MQDLYEGIAADACAAAADHHTTEVTHPLTGERSPLTWANEPEPILWGLLTEQEIPWFAPGASFPGKTLQGEVLAVEDAPPTRALRLIGAA